MKQKLWVMMLIPFAAFSVQADIVETVEDCEFVYSGSAQSPLLVENVLTLPFTFSWGGHSYHEVDLSEWGCLNFSDGYIWVADCVDTTAAGAGMYISNDTHTVTIRWSGRDCSEGSSVLNAAITLFDDGHFVLSYGPNDSVLGQSFDFAEDGYEWFGSSLYDTITNNKRIIITDDGQNPKPAEVNENGLVAYYKFDGDVRDSTTNKNNGVQFGGEFCADRNGVANCAFSFADDSYITIPLSDSLQGITNAFTIAFWLYCSEYDGVVCPIIGACKSLAMNFSFKQRTSVFPGDFTRPNLDGSVFPYITLDSELRIGQWNHWALCVEGGRIRVYRDGLLAGEENLSDEHTPRTLKYDVVVGRSGNNQLKGRLDELRIYNRMLTQEEVENISTWGVDWDVFWADVNGYFYDSFGVKNSRYTTSDGDTIHIGTGSNDGGVCFLTVKGSGTITFKARGSYDGFYYGFNNDGGQGGYVRNSTDYKSYSMTITAGRNELHTVMWVTYAGSHLGGGWGDIREIEWNGEPITYVASNGCGTIPATWAAQYPTFAEKFGNVFLGALMQKSGKKDAEGNSMLVWQDYLAGTDPTDIASRLTAHIAVSNGNPIVSWNPNLNTNGEVRTYKVWGTESLEDLNWEFPTNSLHRFFKVTVEMRGESK